MTALRLNLGCGLQAPAGWVNVDRSPNLLLDRVPLAKRGLRAVGLLQAEHMVSWPKNIRRFDVLKPFPYPPGSASAVYSSHMLEHLYLDQARHVLRESHKVLSSRGVLRLALPDGAAIARALVTALPSDDGEASLAYTRDLLMQPLSAPGWRQRLVQTLASPPHRWQPTVPLVLQMLGDAGFSHAEERGYLSSRLADVAEVEHREESIFVEAVR